MLVRPSIGGPIYPCAIGARVAIAFSLVRILNGSTIVAVLRIRDLSRHAVREPVLFGVAHPVVLENRTLERPCGMRRVKS